jgi:hypothetical protein
MTYHQLKMLVAASGDEIYPISRPKFEAHKMG